MSKVAIFISDLHLGRGDDLDDFPAENENALAEFLDFQSDRSRGSDLDLVVLGDFMDIWQVADDTEKAALKSTDISIDVLDGDQLRRVRKIITAHPLALERFRAFLKVEPERRLLVFVVGNHDHSFVSETVQEEIRNAVAGGDATVAHRIEFRTFYDEPGLRTYAEHGNQYDDNNRYKKFADFGGECPGHYFVRIFWNRLEPMEPNLEVWCWWESFEAIWRHKLWRLLGPALRLFRQYRADPRPFERIDIPGVPSLAARGASCAPSTGKPLSGFPDILFSEFDHPERVFSINNETENLLRALYHDPANREFREWVDQILKEKFGAKFPPVPLMPIQSVPTYRLFHDENVSAVAGMFAPPGEGPRTRLLRGSSLDVDKYDYVLFGHTHEEKRERLSHYEVTYFNTGTWSVRRNPEGANMSRFCFVKIARGDDGSINAVQDFWRPSG